MTAPSPKELPIGAEHPIGALRVARVSDAAQLAVLAEAWDQLIDEHSPGAVFRSSAWLGMWWDHFSAGKELSLYVATDGPRLMGVLPAYRDRSPLGGHRLRLLGDGAVSSDYLGVIARDEHIHPVSKAVADAILIEERDVLLDGVLATDPLIGSLQASARSWYARGDGCPYLAIEPGADFTAWLAARPLGLAKQLARRRRWLQRQPGFRIEVLTGPDDVEAAVPILWELHGARWALEGGTKAVPDLAVERFHADSAVALARRGWVRIYVLHAAGRPRAAFYGFERGKRFSFYQMGTAPEWRNRSVGTVILSAALEDAFERGLREFDFLRGTERYKLRYVSAQRSIVTLRLAGDLRSRLLMRATQARAGLEAIGAEVLPASVHRWLGGRR